jgi:transposase InsO family protein
MPPELVK